jgi:hypothetical protein
MIVPGLTQPLASLAFGLRLGMSSRMRRGGNRPRGRQGRQNALHNPGLLVRDRRRILGLRIDPFLGLTWCSSIRLAGKRCGLAPRAREGCPAATLCHGLLCAAEPGERRGADEGTSERPTAQRFHRRGMADSCARGSGGASGKEILASACH